MCNKGSLVDRIEMERRILTNLQRKSDIPLSEFDIYNFMKVGFNILKELKSKNIMHRDIKPENILFREKNSYELVLNDFGLAEEVHKEPYIYPKCGTPGYVAPEIINIKSKEAKYMANYTEECDVFSLGCVFYVLLTLEYPFGNDSVKNIISRNKKCEIDFSKSSLEKENEFAVDLLEKMLKSDPKQRITISDAFKHPYITQAANELNGYEDDIPEDKSLNLEEKKKKYTLNNTFVIKHQDIEKKNEDFFVDTEQLKITLSKSPYEALENNTLYKYSEKEIKLELEEGKESHVEEQLSIEVEIKQNSSSEIDEELFPVTSTIIEIPSSERSAESETKSVNLEENQYFGDQFGEENSEDMSNSNEKDDEENTHKNEFTEIEEKKHNKEIPDDQPDIMEFIELNEKDHVSSFLNTSFKVSSEVFESPEENISDKKSWTNTEKKWEEEMKKEEDFTNVDQESKHKDELLQEQNEFCEQQEEEESKENLEESVSLAKQKAYTESLSKCKAPDKETEANTTDVQDKTLTGSIYSSSYESYLPKEPKSFKKKN